MSTDSASRRTLVIINAGMFMVMAGFGIVFPIMPFYARDLGASSFEMGLLVTVFALGQLISAPIWGNMSDRYGRRLILLLGLSGYALTFFAMAYAGTVFWLILVRFLAGILSSATFPTAQAYVVDISGNNRAAALGILAGSMNMGFILGPMIGGLLSFMGPITVFLLSGWVVVVTTVATWITLDRTRDAGVSKGARLTELLSLMPVAMRGPLGCYLLLTLIITMGGSSVFSMFSFYMMDKVNALPVHTGYAFTVMAVGSAGVQYMLVGPAIRILGEQTTLYLSFAVAILAYTMIALGTGLSTILAGAFFVGAALGMLRPTVTTAVSMRSTFAQGFTMGTLSAFDSMGRMLGPLVAGFLYAFGIAWPFWASTIMFAGAVVLLKVWHLAPLASPVALESPSASE